MDLASTVGSIAIWTQQQRHMIVLSLLDPEDDNGLREKRLALSIIALDVKTQRPYRRSFYLAQDIVERVDGDFARGGG